MNTAKKLSTAALEADRRLTAMEDPAEAAYEMQKKQYLRKGDGGGGGGGASLYGSLTETAAARPYHRRASDLTDKRLANAAAPPKTKIDDFFGGAFGEGDIVTPGDIAAAIPGYYKRRGSDFTSGDGMQGAAIHAECSWTLRLKAPGFVNHWNMKL